MPHVSPVRGAIGCALLLGVFGGACGTEAPPATTAPDVGTPDARTLTPTERQEKALANPLHRAHLELDAPAECKDCHRIEGEKTSLDDVKHRCLGCHEDHRSTLHAQVADEEARECLSCHEFYEAEVDPWACADCHRPSHDAPLAGSRRSDKVRALRDDAPIARVHVEECQACHLPHGEKKVGPQTCLECHETQTAQHASSGAHERLTLGEPSQCLECHGGHEDGWVAKRSCVGCHEQPGSSLFEGHDRCTDCHIPHSRTGLRSCKSCHSDQVTLAAQKTRDHARCQSCHDPHRVERSSRTRCLGCHEEVVDAAKSHPVDDAKGACVGCHPQHADAEGHPPPTASDCTVCHEEAKTDDGLHGGADCGSCHPAHGFELASEGDAACATCHVEAKTTSAHASVKQVAPIEDHATCTKCHVEAHHEPERPPEACGSCHEEQNAQVVPGHAECVECHLAHEAEVTTTCETCHETKVAMGRHAVPLSECGDCHEQHASRPNREASDCVRCHDEPLPLMHDEEGHGTCGDCHDFHDERKIGDRVSCLAGCHIDQIEHEAEAPRCIGCHPFEAQPREIWR